MCLHLTIQISARYYYCDIYIYILFLLVVILKTFYLEIISNLLVQRTHVHLLPRGTCCELHIPFDLSMELSLSSAFFLSHLKVNYIYYGPLA